MLSFSNEDQSELIKNSVHAVVMLVAQADATYLNYFNCDELMYQKIIRSFPAFLRSSEYVAKMRETFLNFKLDEIEYALYAALLVISPGICMNSLSRPDKVGELRIRIGEMLLKYMTSAFYL